MKVNFLTLGNDCSPAAALRDLQYRSFALPFDWIVSSISSLEICFANKFLHFHDNLHLNKTKSRLIDSYNFEFPHDYPLTDDACVIENVGEGVFGEERGKVIVENWKDYHSTVLEKYKRRVARFHELLGDPKPCIVLCRYRTLDVIKLQKLLSKYYNRENIYFVNTTNETYEDDRILNINTEKNNIWNETSIWKYGIDKILTKIVNY